MSLTNPSDGEIRRILQDSRTIAVVGLSGKEDRPSNQVASYLKRHGYRIIPVNPVEREILGEVAYPSLKDVPEKIDIVDVFRKSDSVPDIAKQAIDISAGVLWLQEGITHEESARVAREAGLTVLQDVCIKKLHAKLL
ncbi:MAG: CoA-binding protein [Candidatus Zixiibacteriota bacterium]